MTTNSYLTFHQNFVEPILAGEKTRTVRYGFERYIARGETIRLQDDTGEQFAVATVTDVTRMSIDEFVEADPDGHASYASVDECVEELAEYYPEAELTPQSNLTVIGFEACSQ